MIERDYIQDKKRLKYIIYNGEDGHYYMVNDINGFLSLSSETTKDIYISNYNQIMYLTHLEELEKRSLLSEKESCEVFIILKTSPYNELLYTQELLESKLIGEMGEDEFNDFKLSLEESFAMQMSEAYNLN